MQRFSRFITQSLRSLLAHVTILQPVTNLCKLSALKSSCCINCYFCVLNRLFKNTYRCLEVVGCRCNRLTSCTKSRCFRNIHYIEKTSCYVACVSKYLFVS